MKNWILSTVIFFVGLSFSFKTSAQYFKASVYLGSTSTSLYITLKPDFNFSDKLNEVGFSLQIPKNAGGSPVSLPTITVLNNFLSTTFPTWVQQSESISDPDFYNFKFGATAVGTAPLLNVGNGSELQVVELQISGPATAIPLTRLAHLAAGGSSSQYGVAFIDGTLNDRTNYVQMFYGNAVVPAVPAPDELTGYNTYQYVLPSGTVPVRFISFIVTEREGNALLNWMVDNENTLTDHYEIERSLDGRDFTKIQTILKTNTSESRKEYNAIDQYLSTLKASGRIYYRIKQTDRDGRFAYTDIQHILLGDRDSECSLYPNPTNSDCNLKFSLKIEQLVGLQITDELGRIIMNQSKLYSAGTNVINIKSNNWAPGIYYIKVSTGSAKHILSLVKK